MAQNNAALELIDLLATRNFDPEIFDIKTGNAPVNDKGKPDNSQGNQFLFHFIGDSGEDYGTVEIVLADGVMTVGSGNNTGRSMTNPQDKNSWFDFLLQLKKFAVRHDFNNFQVDNISRMKYLKQSIAQLTESFQGRGQYSWSGQPTEARMLIKHSRKLAETDARFRHIDSIFLETADGERYRLPTRSLSHGRAMLEHIRAGGRPWDARGAHINHIVEQLQILSRFRRAHQGRLFEGDAADLVNETNNYFGSLRKNLKSLATKSGYSKYFESWQPDAVNESELVVEDLRDLFVETRIDPRIEQALPLLAKIKEHNMKEADIFEAWANRLTEGTWAIPDTEEKMTKLKLFLSQPQAVGADADNATAALGDILGDDNLFDQLEELAETDPDADARPVVQAWLKANQNYPEVMAIVRELEQEPDVDQEISMTAQDMPDAEDNVREGDNLANPLEEVHSPGAMAMFPEEQGVAEAAKWRQGYRASGHPPGYQHKSGEIGPLGGTYDTTSNYGDEVKVPVNRYRDEPDRLADREKTKLSTSGKPLTAKNAARNLKTAIRQAKGRHGPVGVLPEQGVAEGKDEKIAQLKQDYKTAMHWSENARSPQEREEYRRKALKIKNHLEKQYKQGVAEGFHSDLEMELHQLTKSPDMYDAIYNALGRNDKLGSHLQDMMYDVARENRLHPDDDIEQIIAIMADHLESDYGDPDITEGQCNMSEAGTSCPVHGMTECYMETVQTDPKGFAQPTGAAFESQLARIKSLALLK